jgi:butyryl-CoA dehydrogenase
MCSGEWIGAFALTEPDAGSDAGNQKTTVVEQGDNYVINGEKTFISSGNVSDVTVIIGKIPTKEKDLMSAFIVEGRPDGFSSEILKYKMGLRASTTARLKLENVKIPKSNILSEPGKGFRIALTTLDSARVGVAAQAVGIAQRAFDESVKYAKTRQQFGAPIAKLQAIQWMIADMSTRLLISVLTRPCRFTEDTGISVSSQILRSYTGIRESLRFMRERPRFKDWLLLLPA